MDPDIITQVNVKTFFIIVAKYVTSALTNGLFAILCSSDWNQSPSLICKGRPC